MRVEVPQPFFIKMYLSHFIPENGWIFYGVWGTDEGRQIAILTHNFLNSWP